MQISSNSTRMPSALSVAVDKNGRDFCVVVVKGTYAIELDGSSHLADEQEDLVFADVHYGDPGSTSVQYECEFAPVKPRTDLVVNGVAHSPYGDPVTEVITELQIGAFRKSIKVIGDRVWEKTLGMLSPSLPQPFLTMPLIYERAFGGSDHTHENPKHHDTVMRNPVGRGFNSNPDASAIENRPLPNLEDPAHGVGSWSDRPPSVGFGSIGRGWDPRIQYAGTYDDQWLAERSPFLPSDFMDDYFLAAPADQQRSSLRGERIVCVNMAPQPVVTCTATPLNLQLTARFEKKTVEFTPTFDTMIVEPDKSRYLVIYRAAIPLGRKMHALREIAVSEIT